MNDNQERRFPDQDVPDTKQPEVTAVPEEPEEHAESPETETGDNGETPALTEQDPVEDEQTDTSQRSNDPASSEPDMPALPEPEKTESDSKEEEPRAGEPGGSEPAESSADPELEKRTFFEKLAAKPWYIRRGPQLLVICAGMAVLMLAGTIGMASTMSAEQMHARELEAQVTDLQDENTKLQSKVDKERQTSRDLREEINELKHGKSRRLEEVQAAHKDGDWEKTISLADDLHEAYPGSAEDTEGQKLKSNAQNKIKEAEEAEKKKKEEAARKKAEEEARGYETGITYDQLARTPDDYVGEKVKFSGRVIQVSNSDDDVQIRLAINGDYDQVILAFYPKDLVKSKVLEDDQITVYGVSLGDYTYEAVMGNAVTVPLVMVDKIDQ